jgi:hypothetical protein
MSRGARRARAIRYGTDGARRESLASRSGGPALETTKSSVGNGLQGVLSGNLPFSFTKARTWSN